MGNCLNQIPDYLELQIQDKIGKYKASNFHGFLFETDFHTKYNTMLSPAIAKKLAEEINIGYFWCAGDFPYAYGTKEECIEDTVNALEVLKTVKTSMQLFISRGNHDITIKSSKESGYTAPYDYTYRLIKEANSEGAKIFGEKLYYYVDDAANKIRYICIDTCDITQKDEDAFWGVDYGFSDEQGKWLAEQALKVEDDEWHVIAIGHVPCVKGIYAYAEELMPLGEILKDFKNKRKGLYGDFTQYKGQFVAYICGHNHKDLSVIDDNTLFISTGCSSLFNDDVWKRETGNVSETLLDLFALDKGNRMLYALRIGAGEDRQFEF